MTTSFGANVTGNVADAGAGVSGATSAGGVIGAAVGVVGAAVGIASAIGSLIPATLICAEPLAIGVVPFDFNPKEISLSRSLKAITRVTGGSAPGTPTGSTGPIMVKSDPPDITMNELWFEGLTTKWRCDQLLRWMSPTNTIAAQAAAMQGYATASQPPILMFIWGPPKVGFVYQVRLTKVSVTYVRFNPIGIPVRAKVGLNMQQVPSFLSDMPTNPTSGGPGGRRTHVFRSGDSLQSIATTYYGKPGYWRPIAAANRIIDPARVRPGTTVYLPNMNDIAEGSR
jgi:hypothetical protein